MSKNSLGTVIAALISAESHLRRQSNHTAWGGAGEGRRGVQLWNFIQAIHQSVETAETLRAEDNCSAAI